MKLWATGNDCSASMMNTNQVSNVGNTGQRNELGGSSGSHGVPVGEAESNYFWNLQMTERGGERQR